MFFGNPAYNKVEEELVRQLQDQNKGRSPLGGALVVRAEVEVRNESWQASLLANKPIEKYSGTDFDNKQSTICDLLKKAGIVHDDCQFMWGATRKRHGRSDNSEFYKTSIKIERFKEELWVF